MRGYYVYRENKGKAGVICSTFTGLARGLVVDFSLVAMKVLCTLGRESKECGNLMSTPAKYSWLGALLSATAGLKILSTNVASQEKRCNAIHG